MKKNAATTLFVLLCIISSYGQSNFEKANTYFEKRAEKSKNLVAKKRFINLAIKYYRASDTPDARAALLRAYEFKGSFTMLSESQQLKIYKEAVRLGKQSLEEFPNHVGIKYYYIANLGRYGMNINILKAHKQGITDDIRRLADEIMKMDPEYAEAGAQRILGAMNLKVPSVPFVMTWPSDEKAVELLFQAYQLVPENPANIRLYAEALIEENDKETARQLLEGLTDIKPRKDKLLEDATALQKAKELYQKTF